MKGLLTRVELLLWPMPQPFHTPQAFPGACPAGFVPLILSHPRLLSTRMTGV